ncbi:MAG: lipoprotein-releasing ABC transporter permease subunit [Pseudomonadota bacterium]|nr:lipoprotein-releasing ABC transporter permease subunit [Pseudomonadota bacterium]
MFTKAERLISIRNLRPKKKEGFLKIISIFSFLGIMLGVAILIIVMSVMNGFKTDLTKKILGLNPHIVIEPNSFEINDLYISKISENFKNFTLSRSFSGEGIIITNENAKGVILKGVDKNEENIIEFFKRFVVDGNLKDFGAGKILIGSELAYNLNLKEGESINVMSSAFVSTPLGNLPKQENFKVAGIFNTGFLEFDQNLIFLNIEDVLAIFEKDKKDQNVEIYLQDPLKANFYKKKIQKIDQNFFIYTWSDLNKSLFSALKVERNVMFLILSLIVVVAAFNIISGLTILIKNKTKEIAILKTLGLSNNSIKKTFFLTGLSIGFFATVSGIVLGVLFSINVEKIRIFLSSVFNFEIFPSDIYFLEELPSEINLYSILVIFLISIFISMVASYLPAMRISKMSTFRALRYE